MNFKNHNNKYRFTTEIAIKAIAICAIAFGAGLLMQVLRLYSHIDFLYSVQFSLLVSLCIALPIAYIFSTGLKSLIFQCILLMTLSVLFVGYGELYFLGNDI